MPCCSLRQHLPEGCLSPLGKIRHPEMMSLALVPVCSTFSFLYPSGLRSFRPGAYQVCFSFFLFFFSAYNFVFYFCSVDFLSWKSHLDLFVLFCFLFFLLCLEQRKFLDCEQIDSSSLRRHLHEVSLVLNFSRQSVPVLWVYIHFPLIIWGLLKFPVLSHSNTFTKVQFLWMFPLFGIEWIFSLIWSFFYSYP